VLESSSGAFLGEHGRLVLWRIFHANARVYRPTRGNESGSAECSSCLAAATPCVGGEDKDTSNVECMSRRESSKEDKDQADLADGRMEG
jgi:hypothetical protein